MQVAPFLKKNWMIIAIVTVIIAVTIAIILIVRNLPEKNKKDVPLVDNYGNPVNEAGNIIDENGEVIVDENGNPTTVATPTRPPQPTCGQVINGINVAKAYAINLKQYADSPTAQIGAENEIASGILSFGNEGLVCLGKWFMHLYLSKPSAYMDEGSSYFSQNYNLLRTKLAQLGY